jgi:acetyl-CoA synthetase
MESNDPVILCTSGTTVKPKDQHGTGGLHRNLPPRARLRPRGRGRLWCTADIGWVTGHSYVVYGPLANGATVVMYEGAPDWPEKDRLWEIVERYGVTVFYTAPTAIRAFMKWGPSGGARPRATPWDRRPINRGVGLYHRVIGGGAAGGGHVADGDGPHPDHAAPASPPASRARPFPGVDAAILDTRARRSVGGGHLALRRPPPGLTWIWGDRQRYSRRIEPLGRERLLRGRRRGRDADGYWVQGRGRDERGRPPHARWRWSRPWWTTLLWPRLEVGIPTRRRPASASSR